MHVRRMHNYIGVILIPPLILSSALRGSNSLLKVTNETRSDKAITNFDHKNNGIRVLKPKEKDPPKGFKVKRSPDIYSYSDEETNPSHHENKSL